MESMGRTKRGRTLWSVPLMMVGIDSQRHPLQILNPSFFCQESQVKATAGKWGGQNIEEVDTNTAWLQSAQARAASYVDSMNNARNSSMSPPSTGPQSAPRGFRSTMIGTPQSRAATASLGASERLQQVSTDGAGILQQLRVGKSDNDEAATAAAKQGEQSLSTHMHANFEQGSRTLLDTFTGEYSDAYLVAFGETLSILSLHPKLKRRESDGRSTLCPVKSRFDTDQRLCGQ